MTVKEYKYSVLLRNHETGEFEEKKFETTPEVLATIIGRDYPSTLEPTEEENEKAFALRYEAAVKIAELIQGAKILTATKNEVSIKDDEMALLTSNKYDTLVIDEYTGEIPLILVASNYEPYTDGVGKPVGNIIWLDPYDELDFLFDLMEAHYLSIIKIEGNVSPERQLRIKQNKMAHDLELDKD